MIGFHGIVNLPLRPVLHFIPDGVQGKLKKLGIVVVKRRLEALKAI